MGFYEVVGVLGGLGLMGGLALTLFNLRSARKADIGDLVRTNGDVAEYFKGLAMMVVDNRIEAIAVRRDLYERDSIAFQKDISALHRKLDGLKELMESKRMADRIAEEVSAHLDERSDRMAELRRRWDDKDDEGS